MDEGETTPTPHIRTIPDLFIIQQKFGERSNLKTATNIVYCNNNNRE